MSKAKEVQVKREISAYNSHRHVPVRHTHPGKWSTGEARVPDMERVVRLVTQEELRGQQGLECE